MYFDSVSPEKFHSSFITYSAEKFILLRQDINYEFVTKLNITQMDILETCFMKSKQILAPAGCRS